MSIFFHIGMQKTGSTFLEETVFQKLHLCGFDYNPNEIMDVYRNIIYKYRPRKESHLHLEDIDLVSAKKQIKTKYYKNPKKKVFLYSNHFTDRFWMDDYVDFLDKMKFFLPKMKIILFLRYQPNWILSTYYEHVRSSEAGQLTNFVNYKKGKFASVKTIYDRCNFYQMDALSVNYSLLISLLSERWGKKNIYVFFYEDFTHNTERTVRDLCKLIGARRNFITKGIINSRLASISLAMISKLIYQNHRDLGFSLGSQNKKRSTPILRKVKNKFLLIYNNSVTILAKGTGFVFPNKKLEIKGEKEIKVKLENFYKKSNKVLKKEALINKVPHIYYN